MSNVLVDKNKIDLLANAISNKSGESLTLTLDEMVEAVDGIKTGGGGITPTGNINITSAGTTDVTNYATATVPQGDVYPMNSWQYKTVSNARKFEIKPKSIIYTDYNYGTVGYIDDNYEKYGEAELFNAIAKNTTITPTESSQTIGGTNTMMEGAVTVDAIPSNYVGSGITQRSSSDLTASGATVSVPSGYYASNATKSVASGTSGTPTATKGSVSNHSVSVTPSVTNTTGYITGSTKTGTAVTVSASELVSGTLPVSSNGQQDVTNYQYVDVNVSGGGMTVATSSVTLSSAASYIDFTGLSGEPTSFVVISAGDITTSSASTVAVVAYDGSTHHRQSITNTSNAQVSYSSLGAYSTYYNGTLTVNSSGTDFQIGQYKLIYTYGGNSSNIETADVQVGSGATSISFTGLTEAPSYFSCVFKSDFGTSSGYQRTIAVVYDGTSTYGLAMDSGAKALSSWSYTYNNGTLTISSQGTNNGGYFHQPGYYQLTYGIGGEIELEIEPLTVTQNGTYQESGKAYSPVTVNVSSGGSVNIGTKTTTNSSNQNTSISFSSLSGQPKAFFCRLTTQMARSSNSRYYYVENIRWDGSSTGGVGGRQFYMSNGTLTNVTSGYSYSYSNNTLTLTSTGSRSAAPGSFYNGTYELIYIY